MELVGGEAGAKGTLSVASLAHLADLREQIMWEWEIRLQNTFGSIADNVSAGRSLVSFCYPPIPSVLPMAHTWETKLAMSGGLFTFHYKFSTQDCPVRSITLEQGL